MKKKSESLNIDNIHRKQYKVLFEEFIEILNAYFKIKNLKFKNVK